MRRIRIESIFDVLRCPFGQLTLHAGLCVPPRELQITYDERDEEAVAKGVEYELLYEPLGVEPEAFPHHLNVVSCFRVFLPPELHVPKLRTRPLHDGEPSHDFPVVE